MNAVEIDGYIEVPTYNPDGTPNPVVVRMANYLGCSAVELIDRTDPRNELELAAEDHFTDDLLSAADRTIPRPLCEVMAQNVREQLRVALSKLSPREERIVRMYFGMGVQASNFAEIAETLGVSNSRVSGIMQKAFRKLKHPSRCRPIKEACCVHEVKVEHSAYFYTDDNGNYTNEHKIHHFWLNSEVLAAL